MRIGTLFFAAVACAALTACSSMSMKPNPFASRTQCTDAECEVRVTVSSTGETCKPEAPDLDLKMGPAGERKIKWTIVGDFEFSRESYKFALFIKDNPFNEFKDADVPGNGKTLTIKFAHNVTGRDYRYALTVRRSTGNKDFCETLDPWFIT